MIELRQELNVPVGEERLDQAIRAGRYYDLAQAHVQDAYGDRIAELAEGLDSTMSIWSPAEELDYKLRHELEDGLSVSMFAEANRLQSARRASRLVPTISRPAGKDHDAYQLSCDQIEVIAEHPEGYREERNPLVLARDVSRPQSLVALQALEEHFAQMAPGERKAWTSDMLTDRTMHPLEVDEQGILSIELIDGQATVSLDGALRLLNGMRVYFGIEQALADRYYVSTAGVAESRGWETSPHGRALRHALTFAGITCPVDRSPGGKQLDYESVEHKYWRLAHGIVLRNTSNAPLLKNGTTVFRQVGSDPVKIPTHRWHSADYAVHSLEALTNSAVEAAQKDAVNNGEITTATREFFSYLDAHNRIDLRELMGTMMGNVALGGVLTGLDQLLEENVEEFQEVISRMQLKLMEAGVEPADAGVSVIDVG